MVHPIGSASNGVNLVEYFMMDFQERKSAMMPHPIY